MRLTLFVTVVISLAAAADPAEYAQKLDALYGQRDDATAIKEQDKLVSEAVKAHPDDYSVLWRAARLRYWVADGATDDRLKKQLGKEGMNYAERAMKANAGGIEGHYYYAISTGMYSQAVGILKALSEGLESKFVENIDLAIKGDPSFDTCGPLQAKGRYHWELPWPKRDLQKSKDMLDKAIAACPKSLRAQLYLADTLLKDGKAKEAKVAVDKALNGDVAYDPPEGKRVHEDAKATAAKIDDELK